MDITNKQDKEFEDWLSERIRNFNNLHSKHHLKYRKPGEIKHINIKEFSEGDLIAGLYAKIYWNCMKIEDFYIEESYRNKGLGSKLLEQAIKISKEEKCRFIFLETYSFQAPEFYKKFGFYKIGEIKDYPLGESYFTMRLDIDN